MSKELFQDFIQHIEGGDGIPEPFKSVIAEDDWDGGMPYLSIAHYRTGKGKVNVPGEVEKIFMDGKALKSVGTLHESPLGKSVFKSLTKDLVEKREDKIRISIGFLDLEHSHGDRFTFTRKALSDKCPLCKKGVGDKIYKKGHLVHLALTRVPANPRTDMEVEKSMTTKREDAESIIEDEEVLKGLDLKSQAKDVLVFKSEEPVTEPAAENTSVSVSPDVAGIAVADEIQTYSSTSNTPEPTPLEKSFATLKSQVAVIKSQGLIGDEALKQIQPTYEEVANVLRAEFTPVPTPEQVANQNLEATLRSLLAEMLPQTVGQVVAQAVAPIQSELGELRALSLVQKATPKQEEVAPQPRSLAPSLVQRAAIETITNKVKPGSIADIAQRSVGIR